MIRSLLALVIAGAAALGLAIALSPECTINDPPGPTIAGIIRIGGCP